VVGRAPEGREPPSDAAAEARLLGALLAEPERWFDLTASLAPADFTSERCRLIYEAVGDLAGREQLVDVVTVHAALKRSGAADAAGGMDYLEALLAGAEPAKTEDYRKLVERAAVNRRLIVAGQRISQLGYADLEDLDAALGQAEIALYGVAERRKLAEFQKLDQLLHGFLDGLDQRISLREQGLSDRVATGYLDLDAILGGFGRSDLVIVGARPSAGKTSLSLGMARRMAQAGLGVAYFSLEMSPEQLVQRLVAIEAQIEGPRLAAGPFYDEDMERIVQAAAALAQLPLWIDDGTSRLTPAEVRAKARRLASKEQLDCIIVDYLGLLDPPTRRGENKSQEVADISRSLKGVARELHVPVIALCQLNRGVENRDDHRPRMSDLRDSGGIEADADVVLFLYRDEMYNPDSPDRGKAEVIVAKHRNGPLGTAYLHWDQRFARFADLSRRWETPPDEAPAEQVAF
jgi:replicative DNA helicase